MDEKKEPVIYVMPERFYKAPKKGISPTVIFIVLAGVLFLAVVGGSAWYFTSGLRKQSLPIPSVITEVAPSPPAAPPASTPPPIPPPPVSEAEAPLPPVVVEATPSVQSSGKLPRAADTDADGLTDLEEGVFSSEPLSPDTDNDGYLDGHEVLNLYNPTGFEPQKLLDSGLVKKYTNTNFSYEIFYPAKWSPHPLDQTEREVNFQSETGEFIAVIVTENSQNLPLLDWYTSQNPGVVRESIGEYITKTGERGIMSADGLTVYFGDRGLIFAVNYNVGDKNVLNYQRIFEMVLNSFILKRVQ